MRLPFIAPDDLTPEQRPVYDDMRAGTRSFGRLRPRELMLARHYAISFRDRALPVFLVK
jgi:hypothetical protein